MLHVDIEDEDSLSDRLTREKGKGALIDIAVIQVPRMSNYTDFNALELIDGVSVRYVRSVEELGEPDMIVLPGTKNTIDDLKWMRQNGLEASIIHKASNGTVLFGICGGYQMLGRSLADPFGFDSGHKGSVTAGMGLLDTTTEFIENKRTIQMKGRFNEVKGIFHGLTGKEFYGYEIHSGVTHLDPAKALTTAEPVNEKGEAFPEGSQNVHDEVNIYGTYMHGIFDAEGVAATVVEALLAKKGLSLDDVKVIDYKAYKEHQYDILAQSLRENLDMKKINEILQAGL
jgi:adenosylcobyric acid synthase